MSKVLTETERKALMQEALTMLKRAGYLLERCAERHEAQLKREEDEELSSNIHCE